MSENKRNEFLKLAETGANRKPTENEIKIAPVFSKKH